MSFRLSNRVAIITGSSSSLGPAIALAYAAEGASVMCADLKPNVPVKGMEEFPMATHEAISKSGGKAIFVKTDVREEEEIKSLVAETVEEFGRLDMYVT
jgi:NAD(P)-dependent dehydrogenase (short-subunit alcohol dehydrogenase family)